jgi:hypothetical protein
VELQELRGIDGKSFKKARFLHLVFDVEWFNAPACL